MQQAPGEVGAVVEPNTMGFHANHTVIGRPGGIRRKESTQTGVIDPDGG